MPMYNLDEAAAIINKKINLSFESNATNVMHGDEFLERLLL